MMAAAAALLAGHLMLRPSALFQALVGGLVCCVTPGSASLSILRGAGPESALSAGSKHWVCHAEAAVMGMLLTVGLHYVLPAARQVRTRASEIGCVLGLFGSAAVYGVVQILCWFTPYCAARLNA